MGSHSSYPFPRNQARCPQILVRMHLYSKHLCISMILGVLGSSVGEDPSYENLGLGLNMQCYKEG